MVISVFHIRYTLWLYNSFSAYTCTFLCEFELMCDGFTNMLAIIQNYRLILVIYVSIDYFPNDSTLSR